MTDENYPQELKYNKDYSWVNVDDDTATLGVVGPAAKKVKEFVFIQLPVQGKQIQKGDTYASLEAVKWSGHLSSPLSGKIIEVNNDLFDEPETINEDPYGSWIMKVKLDDKSELDELYDCEKAKEIYKMYGE